MHDTNLHLTRRFQGCLGTGGFSTIDAIVAMALSVITIGTVLNFNRFHMYALTTQSRQIETQGNARAALDLIVGELRRAGTDPQCKRNFDALSDARTDRLRLRADLNGNGLIDAAGEDVRYQFHPSSKSLRRTASSEESLAEGQVLALKFQYYDGAGTEIVPTGNSALSAAQQTSVRRIRVTLTMESSSGDPRNPRKTQATFSSNANLRNRFLVTSMVCS
jgi:Tfp pilus assembly protein PilW